MTKVNMIVAIGPDNIIGYKDKLAWHSKLDLQHFKEQTKGCPVIFGATTFFGLPKYPLPNRLNIVLDNSESKVFAVNAVCDKKDNKWRGWVEATSVENALDFCGNFDNVFICGGASIYKYCLENNLIDCVYITKVQCQLEDRNDYIRFPFDINTYLNYEKWDAKLEEVMLDDNARLEFWKYIKKE